MTTPPGNGVYWSQTRNGKFIKLRCQTINASSECGHFTLGGRLLHLLDAAGGLSRDADAVCGRLGGVEGNANLLSPPPELGRGSGLGGS